MPSDGGINVGGLPSMFGQANGSSVVVNRDQAGSTTWACRARDNRSIAGLDGQGRMQFPQKLSWLVRCIVIRYLKSRHGVIRCGATFLVRSQSKLGRWSRKIRRFFLDIRAQRCGPKLAMIRAVDAIDTFGNIVGQQFVDPAIKIGIVFAAAGSFQFASGKFCCATEIRTRSFYRPG